MDHHVYLFDGFTLDPLRRSLMRGPEEVTLGSRALDLLIALVENTDGVLARDYLVSRVWPTTVVEDSSLRVHVAALRRALDDGRDRPRRIVNVPGRGYSFIGPVARRARGPALPVLRPQATLLPALVGRDPALAAVEAMLARHRIVTIAGPGGVGKTGLALHVMSRQAAAFDDQVVRVDLARVGAGASVEQVVADTLGLPVHDLMAALMPARLLLLLDDCEHVVEAAAAFVESVAVQAPRVHVVCTSREPLHVADERVVRLEPLAVAPPSVAALEEAMRYPAIALVVERAKATADTVVFDDGDVPRLRQLCEWLDGVPLALELAAARIHTLGLEALVEQREDLLDLLTRGRRTAAPRHRTLRGLIDWSYDLLDADERRVFCALSLFDGTFSLTSAAALVEVASGSTVVEEIVLALVDKSMLLACPDVDGSEDGTCFRLPPMLRRHGREHLDAMPDAALTRARHARELQRRVRDAGPVAASAVLA